ncbi:MFS general substrate transporter [Aspergillus campestris IBT 28561]|uniref:MFS general substrate transporter n=1 Tax=Aspergillus campestris (strain IBT 28561) TaxID=1392248 RepID=A0A2I1DD14_ASPC2|nr:MFS general substrate transporter [Aspergillus campestris IBT 28561]PKY07769.1 MFS general substrate transporter [Aspergillus campestris IBT 28561]
MHQDDEHGEKSHHGTARSDGDSDHVQNISALEKTSHDTVESGPSDMPLSADPNNPLNWPQWKKDINLVMISFHAMMTNFVGAGIIPVYATFAEMFGVSIQDISYFTSIHILFTGLAPFLLHPLSSRFGRRPIWLVCTFCTAVCNIGCANSNSYAAMIICRILGSLFISAPIALGPPVVVEMYPEHERGYKLGIWTVLVTLGPPVGPFIMGFVAQRVGWEWVYWTFAIVSGVQFVLYFFLSDETRYLGPDSSTKKSDAVPLQKTSWAKKFLTFRRIDPTPFAASDLWRPFLMARHMRIVLSICCHTMVFCLSAALLTVEIPQLFSERFGFDSQQVGLQFLGIIIGTVTGEIANAVFHALLNARTVKSGRAHMKLSWYISTSYIGFACMVVGLVVFCVQLDRTTPMHYSVVPIVGIGIAGFGNQVVANFLINYAMQFDPEHAALTSVLLGFIRQTWCFIGPFWFPPMFETLGLNGSAGLLVGLLVVSVLPLVWMQWRYGRDV